MQATLIEKENLHTIRFSAEEVLLDQQDISSRFLSLSKAALLGNAYKGKVNLHFKSKAQENLSVYTTVWAVAEKYITLKANRIIPIHAITSVKF
jgi:hypothetical protein